MHNRDSLPSACISELRAVLSRNTTQSPEESTENFGLLAGVLRRPLARRRTRELKRIRQECDQRLAWCVQDIIVGRGLIQAYSSIGGGRGWHVPQVVAVIDGPPVALDVRTLPGQTVDDFVAHAPAIAYNLGVAEVRVVPRGPALIRLELLLEQDGRRRAAAGGLQLLAGGGHISAENPGLFDRDAGRGPDSGSGRS